MTVTPFHLIVRDDDAGTFSIEGPMSSDASWTDAVSREQAKGRAVRCSTVPGAVDQTQLALRYSAQERLTHVSPGTITQPVFDLD